jgi:hypothetical protein
MAWGLLSGDPLRFGCGDLEYASLAISAYFGHPVPKPWRDSFKNKAWFAVAQGAGARALPLRAKEESTWLQTAAEICSRSLSHRYAQEYVDQIEAWFHERAAGTPPLPAFLLVDGQVAAQERFLEFLMQGDDAYFQFDRRTRISAEAASETQRAALDGRFVFVVTVMTGTPNLSCVDPSGTGCEGYEWIEFFFDPRSKELLAINVSAAG